MNKQSFSTNNFFNSCRRCLNPWIVALIIVVVVGLIIFVPIIGAVSLIVVLPLLGCTLMCGAMAFMMRDNKKDKQ